MFRRRQFFNGTPAPETARDDLDWYRPDGIPMAPQDWSASYARAVMMALSGDTGDPTRPDDPFMLMLNSWWEPVDFTLPDPLRDLGWRVEIDTEHPDAAGREVGPIGPRHVDRTLADAAARHTARELIRSPRRGGQQAESDDSEGCSPARTRGCGSS